MVDPGRIKQRLNRIEQAGQTLNFVNKDGLLPRGMRQRRQSLFQLSCVASKLQICGLVSQIN
jgi:hypothetical protein